MPRKRDYIPLSGFPREFVFECREEVDAYLSGDRITCLLCGRSYKILDTHLRGAHQIDSDEYRERYGLPYRRGLCSVGFSDNCTQRNRELWSKKSELLYEALGRAKEVQRQFGNPQRNKPKFWVNESIKYDRGVYEEFIRRVLTGRAISDVGNDPDMPFPNHVRWYMERDKEFAQLWNEKVKPVAKLGWKPGLRRSGAQQEAA